MDLRNAVGGKFGPFGGRYVSETLIAALDELEAAYQSALSDPEFDRQYRALLADYVGRPTPLYHAERLSNEVGVEVWLKREDLCHTGAHKINNTVGQVLLAKRMGKSRVIAETGAGQHGVATATACALFGLKCVIFMGAEDARRQALNVERMKLLGAEVSIVNAGSRTLKDAMNEALRDWVSHVNDTYYCVGSAAGPHPYPSLVRDFQIVIGQEAREQIQKSIGQLPTHVIACVGGGSNAIGIFDAFLDDAQVKLIGVEAGGLGIESCQHGASLSAGRVGVLHGAQTFVLQTADGQIQEAHSISAGLDYPGVGPQHAWLKESKRVHYVPIEDALALKGFHLLARTEGILPALESSHAIAYLLRPSAAWAKPHRVLINLSGRGDKDLHTVLESAS